MADVAGNVTRYGYDALSRLVSVGRTDGPAESFAYDRTAWRTEKISSPLL